MGGAEAAVAVARGETVILVEGEPGFAFGMDQQRDLFQRLLAVILNDRAERDDRAAADVSSSIEDNCF
jgi:hypothetical protein